MSLRESVDLVEHAFLHAETGDLFVRKAPACTVEVLAKAVASILGEEETDIKMIGTRHGEKLHETLLSREEMLRATDQGKYFKVPLDVRSMQYESFYEDGQPAAANMDDYTSENTDRLDLEDTKKLLLTLPEIGNILGMRSR